VNTINVFMKEDFMAGDDFEDIVLKALEKIQKTQAKHTKELNSHTKTLDSIGVNLKINSRYVCGAISHSLEEIEKAVEIDPLTDFQGELQRATKAVLS